MEYRKITHNEFITLKCGQIVYIKVGNIYIERIVYKTPFLDESKNKLILKTFKPRTTYEEKEIYIKVEDKNDKCKS